MTGTTEVNSSYLPSYMVDSDGNIKSGYESEAERISQGVYSSVSILPPTEKYIFLSLLKTDERGADETSWTTDKISETLAELVAIAENIADYFETAGGFRSVAQVLIQNFFLLYTDALQSRLMSREICRDLMLQQADEKRKEGKTLKEGAIVSMSFTLAMGLVSTVLAGISMGQASKQASAARAMGINEQKGSGLGDLDDNCHVNDINHDNIKGNKSGLSQNANIARSEYILSERRAMISNSTNESFRAIGTSTNGFIQADFQKKVKDHEAEGIEMGGLSGYEGEESNLERDIQNKLFETARFLLEEIKTLVNIVSQDMGAVTRNSTTG